MQHHKTLFCVFANQVKTALLCKTKYIFPVFSSDVPRCKRKDAFFFSLFHQELFESLHEKLEEDLIEALAALSLSKAMYDARTLDQAMQVSYCLSLSQACLSL